MDSAIPTTSIAGDPAASQPAPHAVMLFHQIWFQGIQDLSKTVMEIAQTRLTRSMSNWNALSGVKSLPEAMAIQKLHASTSMEELISCTGKLADASLTLCQQTIVPMTEQMTLAMQKTLRKSAYPAIPSASA